jgi:hypothetical protein
VNSCPRARGAWPRAVALTALVGTTSCAPSPLDAPPEGDGAARCPIYDAPEPVATVDAPELTEASGLAASARHDGVFWTHNDSGDSARIFAIDALGALVAVVALDGAAAVDLEDLALGPGPDGAPWIFVGDIGDNRALRDEIVVYGVPEPEALGSTPESPLRLSAEAWRFTYPDGPRDAESLIVEPDGALVILTKAPDGVTGVYRASAPHTAGALRTLDRVGQVVIGEEPIGGDRMLTAADLSTDGRLLALRTYLNLWVWTLAIGEPVEDALARPPCRALGPPEPQGEAVAIDARSATLWTLSEGRGQPLYRMRAR